MAGLDTVMEYAACCAVGGAWGVFNSDDCQTCLPVNGNGHPLDIGTELDVPSSKCSLIRMAVTIYDGPTHRASIDFGLNTLYNE